VWKGVQGRDVGSGMGTAPRERKTERETETERERSGYSTSEEIGPFIGLLEWSRV
jgi:hypothetical protein